MSFFSGCHQVFLPCLIVFNYYMSYHWFSWVYPIWNLLSLLNICLCLSLIWGSFQSIYLQTSCQVYSLLFWDFQDMTTCSFVIVSHDHRTLLHTSPFSLGCSGWVISIDLSQHLLTLPAVISILLVSWSSELFILVTIFFSSRISIWLFFITSISLLRFSVFFICFKIMPNCLLKQFDNFTSDSCQYWLVLIVFSDSCCNFPGSWMTRNFSTRSEHFGLWVQTLWDSESHSIISFSNWSLCWGVVQEPKGHQCDGRSALCWATLWRVGIQLSHWCLAGVGKILSQRSS